MGNYLKVIWVGRIHTYCQLDISLYLYIVQVNIATTSCCYTYTYMLQNVTLYLINSGFLLHIFFSTSPFFYSFTIYIHASPPPLYSHP